jgi:hypothetical protein
MCTFKIELSDENYWILREKTTGEEAVRDLLQSVVEKAIQETRKILAYILLNLSSIRKAKIEPMGTKAWIKSEP